jgi:hypothetical protein
MKLAELASLIRSLRPFSIEVARNVPLKFIQREKFFRETSCATMKADRLQGVADVASTGKGQ